jgi:hypothetical protein
MFGDVEVDDAPAVVGEHDEEKRTRKRAARELGPILAEAPPLPSQNGVGGYDHDALPPPGSDLG